MYIITIISQYRTIVIYILRQLCDITMLSPTATPLRIHDYYYTTTTNILQYSTVQYSTIQYSTVQYSTVQYSTVQYSKYSTMHGIILSKV